MQSTILDKILVQLFRESKLSKENAALLFILLETEEQQLKMAEFLYNNPNAPGKEIVQEAGAILRQRPSFESLFETNRGNGRLKKK